MNRLQLRLLSISLATAFSLSQAYAATVTHNNLTYTLDETNHTAQLTNANNTTAVTIPYSVSDENGDASYIVTSIASGAFSNCSQLNDLTIADGNNALELNSSSGFGNCPLERVYIGRNLSSSSSTGVFFYQKKLVNVTFGDYVTTIPNRIFQACSAIPSIVIPDNVTSIGERAFGGCTSLSEITMPNALTEIGAYAFSSCSSLAHINLPSSLQNLGISVFEYCTALDNVIIPEGISSVNNSMFYGCTALTSITLNDNIETIGNRAFWGCTALTEIKLPSGLKAIGDNAFEGDNMLSSIVFSDNLASIGKEAFKSCSKLESITIPASVTLLGYSAFQLCKSLKELILEDGEESIAMEYFRDLTLETFDPCPLEKIHIGRNIIYMDTNGTIKEGSNWNAPFYYCRDVTEVTFGNTVTKIPNYLFACSLKLKSIDIPTSVTSIGEYAFYQCQDLLELHIPASVTSIGNYAFSDCGSLQEVHYSTSEPITSDSYTFGTKTYENATLYLPASAIEKAVNITPWNLFKNVMAETALVKQVILSDHNISLSADEKVQLGVTIEPSDADQDVLWSSSDEHVATVDNDGLVTAISEGEAIIKATSISAPEIGDECLVTVSKTTGIDSIDADTLTVIQANGFVTVKGVNDGITVMLVNTSGQTVDSCVTSNHTANLKAKTPGIYIVIAGDKTLKVTL